VPVVDVQIVLDAGAARDPADLPGLATFTATMLQQGAGRRGALDIADAQNRRRPVRLVEDRSHAATVRTTFPVFCSVSTYRTASWISSSG